MPGYLDEYGVADSRREKLRKRVVLIAAAALVLGAALYFTFRDWRQERLAKAFVEQLRRRDFPGAYRTWGCTEARPCRDYAFEKFMEDWGPASSLGDVSAARVATSERCGSGVVIVVDLGGKGTVSLWADRNDGTLGFAPWPECPGRKFLPWRWLKRKLAGTP